MLAVQKTVAGPGVEVVDIAEPSPPGPHEVLIRVGAAGICGSDVHLYAWDGSSYASLQSHLPLTLGHEFAGEVVAIGAGVSTLACRDRVTAIPSIGCGTCRACDSGNPHECPDQQALGLTRAGCFTRYVCIPARACLQLPANVDDELGALIEPLTIASNAVRVAQVEPGQHVLVQGVGPIGQGMALFARRAGADDVVLTGMNDPVRFAVLRRLGFERLIDLAGADSAVQLAAARQEGFDVVLEATGVPQTIEHGLRALRRGGVLVTAGIHPAPATFDVTHLVRRSLQIRGAYGAPVEVWRAVIDLLASQPETVAPMITHRLPLADAAQGLTLAHSRQASKVLLLP